MQESWSRLVLLAALSLGLGAVAGPALAGGTPGGGLSPGGTLTLQLGAVDQWVLVQNAITVGTQAVGASTLSGEKCFLSPAAGSLVNSSSGGDKPGFVGDSIGVWGGGNSGTARGTACGRVGGSEVLRLTLGSSLSGLKVSETRLDIEVKQNAKVVATAKLAGQTVASFELRSGSSIVTGQGSTTPGSPIFNCTARSDSGPDSGSSDNCTWAFQVLYDTLDLRAAVGEFSLEGGGDWGSSAAQNYSQFELVNADGVLACGDTVTEAADGTTTVITRNDDSTCVLIPYSLAVRDSGGTVDFFTPDDAPLDQNYIVDITWQPELSPGSLQAVPLTINSFNGIDFADLDLCVGTVVYDGPNPVGLVHGQGTPYACVVSQTVDYDPIAATADDQIQVRQIIYLEGDWTAGRR